MPPHGEVPYDERDAYEQAKLREKLNPGLPPLSGMSTRELMALRKRCYECGNDWYSPIDSNGPGYYLRDILSELDGREHVPNKKEAQAIRRARQSPRQKRTLQYRR